MQGGIPWWGREGSHSWRAQKSSLGAVFYLTLVAKTRKIGTVLAFSLLKLLGICRVGLGVLLLW